MQSTESKPFPGEAENTAQSVQPFFSSWRELYRFFLTPLEADHPFRCSAGESANDRLHNVGELWGEWREYLLRIRFKDSDHPKRPAKRRMSKRSPNARNTADELIPGIHRPAWYFSNLILYRSKQARAASDWKVCLAWLTNRREDLTFSIDPLLDMGPRNPPRILLHFQEGILDRSRFKFRSEWVVAVLVSIAGSAYLALFHNWILLLWAVPALLLMSAVVAVKKLPVHLTVCAKVVNAARQPRNLQLRYKGAFFPASAGFAPLEDPSLRGSSKCRWALLISLERWRYNHAIFAQLGGFLLSFRIPAMVLMWGLSRFVGEGALHDWDHEVMIVTAAAVIQLSSMAFRRESTEFMREFYRYVGRRYPPSASEVEQFMSNHDGDSVDEPVVTAGCDCPKCLLRGRPPPPVLPLLAQLTHIENALIPIVTIGTYVILLTEQVWWDEQTPSIRGDSSFLSQLIMPHALWHSCASIALSVLLLITFCFWCVALA